LIRLCSQKEDSILIQGDFAEEFTDIAVSKGLSYARRWYWKQTLRSIPVLLKNKLSGGINMVKHYYKIALRNILRQKGFSFINIAGLTIGMACFIFIMIWIQHELSYDQFHEKKDQLFRILYKMPNGRYSSAVSYAMPPVLKDKYPEVTDMARVWPWHRSLVKYKEKRFEENRIYLTDPGFFEMFTFQLVHGNLENALPNKNSIVLTQKTAHRYFGNQNPIGEILHLETPENDFVVTAVIANIPANSHLQFDMAARVEWLGEKRLSRWNEWVAPAYLFLNQEASVNPNTLNRKMAELYKQNVKPDRGVKPVLQPLTKVHLYEYGQPGRIIRIYIFSIIAVFILLMACINFMNLSTARSVQRAREVGMRKVVGATRSQVVNQFLGEALLFSFLAMGLAVILVISLFSAFQNFTGQKLVLSLKTSLPILFFTTLATGLFAGSIPAIFLSSYKPVQTIKNQISRSRGGTIFRRILITFQFTLSGGLILCTLIISKQLTYIYEKDLGMNRNQVVTIMNNPNLINKFDAFKHQLKGTSGVLEVTCAAQRPMQVSQAIPINWKGNSDQIQPVIGYTMVDYDFFATFEIPVIEGRSFSPEFATDPTDACMINESAVKMMGLKNSLGTRIYFNHRGIDPSLRNLKVIGVVKDFHFRSLRREIGPFIFRIYRPWHQYIFIKIAASRIPETLQNIGKVFKIHAPDYPFRYEFIEAAINRQYSSELNLKRLFNLFSLLSIIVACLGLFGLASFTAEQKMKEIGIRKVLGATVIGIVIQNSKEFIKWIILANLIAWPLAYYLMAGWLNNFSYKISFSLWIFLSSAGLILIIAFFTIIYQTLKAAMANPVHSLRHE
jgi:ABC-type antimicrobial peptide transport system permease subunit